MTKCIHLGMSGSLSASSVTYPTSVDNPCRILSSRPKSCSWEFKTKFKYTECEHCAVDGCLACPEESFIAEDLIEVVSDDLSFLRCQLCELNLVTLAQFVPEPWYNYDIIEERLTMLHSYLRTAHLSKVQTHNIMYRIEQILAGMEVQP